SEALVGNEVRYRPYGPLQVAEHLDLEGQQRCDLLAGRQPDVYLAPTAGYELAVAAPHEVHDRSVERLTHAPGIERLVLQGGHRRGRQLGWRLERVLHDLHARLAANAPELGRHTRTE